MTSFTTIEYLPSKRIISLGEESATDSASGREEDKTIPFLRRLCDMLTENEKAISFKPGHCENGKVVLGRIVVHDRVNVESKVLPRYFNHSSFASLRRQLNYFSFVRLGKGRQRESTYTNENVVLLEDILHLKRRSVVHADPDAASTSRSEETSVSVTVEPEEPRPTKRRRGSKKLSSVLHRTRAFSPVNNLVSEDERSESKQYIALDLTKPSADDEILAGCNALLDLAKNEWN